MKINKIAEGYLGEISQSMNLKMALLHKVSETEYNQLTPHVKCRDFLCDVYSSDLEKCTFGIYGMKGLWPNHPDWEAVQLHLIFPTQAAKDCFTKNLSKLQAIEKGQCAATEYTSLEGLEGLVIGDKTWLGNAMTFSLYTFLLRMMCYELPDTDWIKAFGQKQTSDSKYAKSIDPTVWDKVLKDLSVLKTKDFCGLSFKGNGTGSVHHNSGFISVFGTHSEINTDTVRKNKHWQEMKDRGFKLHTA